jgi:hypothetical protein
MRQRALTLGFSALPLTVSQSARIWIFVEGKYAYNNVDHSDSATYWVLLGNWGVSLNDIPSDGTNSPAIEEANEQKFRATARRIHDELLRRSTVIP